MKRVAIALLLAAPASAFLPARAQQNKTPPPAKAAASISPAISGELFKPERPNDVARVKTVQAIARAGDENALVVDFSTGENAYPNVQFPVPEGGWNLSAFGGVHVEVTNRGTGDVTAALRVDNPGDWRESPWNTESVGLRAGETKTLAVIFGQSSGGPAYPLDAKKIVGIQVFLIQPKQNAAIGIKNLNAFGSPRAGASSRFSTPADRDKPVKPPIWLGKRPPDGGDWVQTLNENFSGKTINDAIWSDRTWWNGLLGGQTQRYSRKNLVLENGILRFKTEKRRGPQYDDPGLPEREYTTGHLITYGKWTQCYGYFEARMKLPTARGLWPAFWMMPDRGPNAGPEGWKREDTRNGGMEIDILEHLTEWGPGRANIAAHWDGYDTDHKQWGDANVYYGPTPDGWHTWGLLWEPKKLTWYCDGIKKGELVSDRIGSVPVYLILNVQMGGWATKDVDDANLPDALLVDYVRAWQSKSRLKGKAVPR